ncbi:MAG: S9 family peptidase, partial [Gemmatimonadetes bacterium]|nr:S9 family peptidase [Gemmatimonadota bacterium]
MIRILIAAGSISLLSAIPTAAQNTPFSDLDVFQVEYASDVQISPDGGWVVYVRTAMSIMRDRREGRLWMVRTDGTQHRQVTSSDQSQSSPRWSPDGSRIA